jgi:hypothetical protein
VLIVAEKMASGYALHFPWWTIWSLYAVMAGAFWVTWRGWRPEDHAVA